MSSEKIIFQSEHGKAPEILSTSGLTKVFGHQPAVDHVDMTIRKGDIYGLIGQNGAGKTTIIRMIAGLAKPTEGSIYLFGSQDLIAQRKKLGTVIEYPALYPQMTAEENLTVYAKMLGISYTQTIPEILRMVGLENTGKKKAKNFSLGMKQRLAIAISLMDDPQLLILDEPTNGLDPIGIREIRQLILKLNQENGITVLISSHILGELSKLATRYGIVHQGKMIREFTEEELMEKQGDDLEEFFIQTIGGLKAC